MTDEDKHSLATIETSIQRLFKAKTPKSAIKMRQGARGLMFPYVPIDYVVSKLDETFGIYWEFLVDDVRNTGKQIIVRGRLVVKSPGGFSISRPGVGRAAIKMYQGTKDPVDEGNDEKAATSDAIKKAASLFGIAADVYYKEIEKYDDVPETIDGEQEQKRHAMSKFFGIAADRGFDGEAAKKRIKEVYGVAHMEDLGYGQIEAATRSLEKYYEVVESGEKPRKIGEAPIPSPEATEEISPDKIPDGLGDPPTIYCRNTDKHGEEQEPVPVGSTNKYFCCQDCEDMYWHKGKYAVAGDPKSKRFEEFMKRGRENAQFDGGLLL